MRVLANAGHAHVYVPALAPGLVPLWYCVRCHELVPYWWLREGFSVASCRGWLRALSTG